MDSDSDSDGSHISATPPRVPNPSPSPQPPKISKQPLPPQLPKISKPSSPPEIPRIVSKTKSKVRIEASPPTLRAAKQKTRLTRGKEKKLENLPEERYQQDSSFTSSSTSPSLNVMSSFSLPIHYRNSSMPGTSSTDILSAGSRCVSKSISFTKIQKRNLDFDFHEGDLGSPSRSSSKAPVEVNQNGTFLDGVNIDGVESIGVKGSSVSSGKCFKKPSTLIERGAEGGSLVNPRKGSKRPSNLIGSGVSMLSAKRPKGGNEGNFVKLNINGHGRKFANRFRKKNFTSSRSGRWRKRRYRVDGKGENNGENGFISEINRAPEIGDDSISKLDQKLIENAVLDVRSEASEENLMKLLKLTHGYDSFREGQLEAIKMVLAKKSTMLLLPTGAGKSLCYQLPAIILPGITLVVSPLVALMIDQQKQLPPLIRGAVLCSSQSLEEIFETLQLVQEGAVKVLFVSPERMLNADFISVLASSSISLLVVDEAHCVSEWSHNFRPSYMRLRASILRDKLKVECILAMTATATRKTLHTVMSALDIPPTNVVETTQMRNNLQLSVSLSANRMKDLIHLIKSSPFSEVKSIIIYCKFQSETDLISKYLCDNNISAKSYHSGMLSKDRNRVQALFCNNKLRVVVATVAFGMGLDKSDIGAVIHYSLPGSMEEYVQETGRAGRDGRLSHCHLIFDNSIYYKLRSLMFSEGIDEYAVNQLIGQVFSGGTEAKGKIRSLVIESSCRKLDIKEEVILTILTQLELGQVRYLSLLPQSNITCCLNFHKTVPLELAHKDLVVAAILNQSEAKHGQYVFDIPTLANITGVTTTEVLEQLRNLKFMEEITYELKDPAFCYTIVDIPRDMCSLATQIKNWLSEIEDCKVQKLDRMFNAVAFAVKKCSGVHGCHGAQHTSCLQRTISDYFVEESEESVPNAMNPCSPFMRADIKVFLQSNSHAKFTPRAVARIMHGIGSPAYPAATWSKTHFWGRYTNIDFKVVMEAAKAELLNFVGRNAT